MNKKNLKISLIFNIIISMMVILGVVLMIAGVNFTSNVKILSATGFSPFKYYTVDSNLFVGLSSIILCIYEYLVLKKKINEIPKFVYILKYIGVVGVTLTFLVTLFYLVPMYGKEALFLYQNSNLLLHLFIPMLSFISFVFFEKVKLEFKYTLFGTSTMVVYGIYYIVNILIHQNNGIITREYDLYGFVKNGISSILIIFPLILIITYMISLIIFKINQHSKN